MQAEQVIQGLTGLGRGGGGGVDPLVQIWNRARSSHQALGHHQVHSGGRDMWNISAEIYQIRLCSCFPCLLLFWRSRYMSGERHPNISFHFKSFVPSVRIREDFGLVIGRRLYKTRWRQLLLPCYPATLPSILLCRTVCHSKLRCSVPLRHSPSASHTPTLHPASL